MRGLPSLSLAALFAVAIGATAGEREDAQARAALELTLALKQKPKAAKAIPTVSYADAYAQSLKSGRTILLHVGGFDCGDVCQECPSCIRATAPEVGGDKTPRLIVAYPQGGRVWIRQTFTKRPSLSAVKAAVSDNCESGFCPSNR